MSPYAEMCFYTYLYALYLSMLAQHDTITAVILFGSTL